VRRLDGGSTHAATPETSSASSNPSKGESLHGLQTIGIEEGAHLRPQFNEAGPTWRIYRRPMLEQARAAGIRQKTGKKTNTDEKVGPFTTDAS